MSWFTWTLLVYFWSNLLYGIKIIGKEHVYTKNDVGFYVLVTAFMTWAAITQVG